MTYGEIISGIQKQLPPTRAWWPVCFYHYTNIQNAIGILDKGWIYARETAMQQQLMRSDNASASVINVTGQDAKEMARLYFRPLTPTQYHNEGYKPSHIRNHDVDANCPVPIFFCLDAEKVLSIEGVSFVECGMAGRSHQALQQGVDAYAKLNFEKIYHHGPHEKGSDITQYRRSEIVRQVGIPTKGTIRKIYCRSLAEKQTLLSLVKKQLPHKYEDTVMRVGYDPKLYMFFNNGVFVREVARSSDGIIIMYNDPEQRDKKERVRENGQDLLVSISLFWLHPNSNTAIHREAYTVYLNYASSRGVKIPLPQYYSNRIELEIYFNDCLMYSNEIDLSEQILV